MIGINFFKRKRSPEKDLQQLCDALKSDLGNHLGSILLFGSMASGEFDPARSDVNVLVVADLSFDMLQEMTSALRAWTQKGHVLPILVERRELSDFARDFPIEFLDMQAQHRLLYGDNPLTPLTVNRVLLRAQCERELALNHLKLRQAFALAGHDQQKIREILMHSVPSILTLFRAVYRLDVPEDVKPKLEASQQLAERIGFDPAILTKLHALRIRRSTDNLEDLATHYLRVLWMVLDNLRQSKA